MCAGRRIRSGVPLALALLLAAPAGAAAAPRQESLVEDEQLMLRSGPQAREQALDDSVALGADGVRALVRWSDIAPAPRSLRRPAGFDAADPGDYAAARWDPLDDLVRGTAARGLSLLVNPSTPAPAWASRCTTGTRAQRQVCRPGARAYGAFLRALGRRYSGRYADENQGGGRLPRVTRWSFGNEPNQGNWLMPQYARRDGVTYVAAAVTYRALARSAIAALRATGHGRDRMLLGETSPIGRDAGALARRPAPPGAFARALLCIDREGRRLRGRRAAVTGCGSFRRLRVTGWAHHPYTLGGSRPPLRRGDPRTEITIGAPGRLIRILDAAARHGRIPRRLPVHYTEYGFQTNPPDSLVGIPLSRHGEYLNQSDWLAYRNPRIRSVAQYKLIDDTAPGSFQSGLRFAGGMPKPSYDAYRLPLWVGRRGATRLRIYGQVRPAARGTVAQVELQNAPLGVNAFKTVATIPVRSRHHAFVRTIARREGRWRLRWLPPGASVPVVSRVAVPSAP